MRIRILDEIRAEFADFYVFFVAELNAH